MNKLQRLGEGAIIYLSIMEERYTGFTRLSFFYMTIIALAFLFTKGIYRIFPQPVAESLDADLYYVMMALFTIVTTREYLRARKR